MFKTWGFKKKILNYFFYFNCIIGQKIPVTSFLLRLFVVSMWSVFITFHVPEEKWAGFCLLIVLHSCLCSFPNVLYRSVNPSMRDALASLTVMVGSSVFLHFVHFCSVCFRAVVFMCVLSQNCSFPGRLPGEQTCMLGPSSFASLLTLFTLESVLPCFCLLYESRFSRETEPAGDTCL